MELTVYWTQFAEEKLEDIFAYYTKKEACGLLRNSLIL